MTHGFIVCHDSALCAEVRGFCFSSAQRTRKGLLCDPENRIRSGVAFEQGTG